MGPTAWKGPNPLGTNITNLTLVSTVGPTTTTVINKNVVATYTGSATNGSPVNIIKTITVTTKTYNWYGTGFIYGVLTTTQTVTQINPTGRGGAAPTGVVTVKTVTSGGTGTVNPGDTFSIGTTFEYTGANPPNSVTSPSANASNTLPPAVCSDFTLGTTFNTAFGYGSTSPMRAILCASVSSDDSLRVTAMLNAAFYDTSTVNYVMTIEQMKVLGSITPLTTPYAGYASLSAFFDINMAKPALMMLLN